MQSSRIEPNLNFKLRWIYGAQFAHQTAFGDGHDNVRALAEDHQ
jgi:hypothetical protein